MTTPADFALVISAGLAGGFINAAAGGGSLILYPALVAIGLPSVDANVTNSVALWPGYLGNVLGLRDQILSNRASVTRLLPVAIVGAVAGCVLLLATPSSAFDVIVPFLVLLASALLAAQPRLKLALTDESGTDRRGVLTAAVGLGSVYGGYFGGGLGVILLAVLGLSLPGGIRVANAVKGALSFVINTVSVLTFASFGPVHWQLALAIAPGALAGGVAGARFSTRIQEAVLRRFVVTFGFAIGIWLAVRAF